MDEMELQALLSIKRTRAYILAKEMTAEGLIKIVGRGKKRRYVCITKQGAAIDLATPCVLFCICDFSDCIGREKKIIYFMHSAALD